MDKNITMHPSTIYKKGYQLIAPYNDTEHRELEPQTSR